MHNYCLMCRYSWIRSANRPCTKRTSTRRRSSLVKQIDELILGRLPDDERIQLEADLSARKTKKVICNCMCVCVYVCESIYSTPHTQAKDTLNDTLRLVAETGPAITACRAPIGRPSRRSSVQQDQTTQSADQSADQPDARRSQNRPAPPGVERKYNSMKKNFTKGKPVGKTTFVFDHKLGAGYSLGAVTTCIIHIVDPGAVYGVPTPCPKCGFGVQTDPIGWTRNLR